MYSYKYRTKEKDNAEYYLHNTDDNIDMGIIPIVSDPDVSTVTRGLPKMDYNISIEARLNIECAHEAESAYMELQSPFYGTYGWHENISPFVIFGYDWGGYIEGDDLEGYIYGEKFEPAIYGLKSALYTEDDGGGELIAWDDGSLLGFYS